MSGTCWCGPGATGHPVGTGYHCRRTSDDAMRLVGVSADPEGLAMRLKTLLHNGKVTGWESGEQRRYYELVVSKLLDPAAPPVPPRTGRFVDVSALLRRLDELDEIAARGAHLILHTDEVRELLGIEGEPK